MASDTLKVEKVQSSAVTCSTCKYEIGTDCQHPDNETPGFYDQPESSCWQKKIILKIPL